MATDTLNRAAGALGRLGGRLVQPDDDTASDLAVKSKNINEYKRAVAGKPTEEASAERPAGDPINPSARYGDRGREKRIDTRSMAKPLGSFKRGVARVPKTGPYKLHKDEAVVNKAQANKMRAAGTLGGGKSKAKPQSKKSHKKKGPSVHRLHIRHAANGGYIAEHEFKGQPGIPQPENQEHQLGNIQDLQAHVGEMMGGAPQAAAPPPQGPSPDQMAQPGSFERGGVVEKTGWAKVHAGERVIPA